MARPMLYPGTTDISSFQEGTMKKNSRITHRSWVALAALALSGMTATIASSTPTRKTGQRNGRHLLRRRRGGQEK